MDIAELGLAIRSDGVVVAKNRLKDFENQAERTEKRAAAMGAVIGKAFALIGAAVSVNQIVNYTNTWTDLNSRVEIATGSMGQGAATMQRLSEMARRTYSSLELTAETFLLNARAMKDLGYNSGQTLDFVESVNNALVVSGAKGERAASVVNALSKAMALGKLSGDQLETVLSTGGRVAEALADSMGVTTLELRALGAAGKITGKEIFGITTQLERLREEADSMPATIGDAVVLFGNAMLEMVGKMDQAVDGSSRVAEAIIWAADNIEGAIPIVGGLATVIAVALIPQITAATYSFGALTIAMLANPFVQIALVAGTLAGAMIYLNQQQSLAAQSAQAHAEALTTNANAIEVAKTSSQSFRDGLRQQIQLQLQAAEAALNEAGAQYKAAEARAAFGQKFGDAMSIGARIFGMPGPEGDYGAGRGAEMAQDTIDRALQGINTTLGRVQELKGQLGDLAAVEANYSPVEHALPGAGPSKGALKAAANYADITRGAKEFIAAQQLEAQALGMTAEAANRLRYEQDLLNKAANDNLKLTPAQRNELSALATEMAAVEERTRSLSEWYDIGRTAFGGFMSDFKRDLMSGTSLWESFGNAAGKALDSIADRALSMAANGIFDMIFGSLFGGLGGGNSLGGGWGVAGGFGGRGIFGIPGLATGGTVTGAGLSWVGEQGPELLRLPQGAQVIPNGPSVAMAANQNAANSNGQVTVRLLMPDGWRAEILEEAGSNAVRIVQANDTAQRNYQQNGGM